LRPNQSPAELRRTYRETTSFERLRTAAELSHVQTRLAALGANAVSHAPQHPLRFFDILRALREHNVDFILIGGFSLAFHGHPRGTDDVDIVPDPDPANLGRLWTALEELRAEPRDLDSLLAGGSCLSRTDLGKLDILQTLDGVPLAEQPWQLLREHAHEVDAPEEGVSFLVASRDDLIMLKRATGRDQDLIDVETLRLAEGRDE